jgi:hypothetical protein
MPQNLRYYNWYQSPWCGRRRSLDTRGGKGYDRGQEAQNLEDGMSAQSTGQVIEKVSYTHEKLLDMLVANPRITQRQLAAHFGYTEGWLSQVMRSDAFREMYEARRKELVDPTIMLSLEQRFSAATHRALDILLEDLDTRRSADVALKVLSEGRQALGMGAQRNGPGAVQVNFVVAMPEKAENAETWLEQHKPASRTAEIIDLPPTEPAE